MANLSPPPPFNLLNTLSDVLVHCRQCCMLHTAHGPHLQRGYSTGIELQHPSHSSRPITSSFLEDYTGNDASLKDDHLRHVFCKEVLEIIFSGGFGSMCFHAAATSANSLVCQHKSGISSTVFISSSFPCFCVLVLYQDQKNGIIF